MKSIIFSELSQFNTALIDSSSIQLLCDEKRNSFFSEKCSSILDPYNLQINSIGEDEVLWILDVLSRLIAYEYVCVDGLAWKNRENIYRDGPLPAVIEPLICETTISKSFYEISFDTVLKMAKTLGFGSRKSHDVHPLFKGGTFWDASDKKFHDSLRGEYGSDVQNISWVSHSTNSPARVLFYLELARLARVPVFLNPFKRTFFDFFNQRLIPEVLKIIEQESDKQLFHELQKIIAENQFGEIEFKLPPLADYIVNNARKKNLSIYDSVADIRSRDEVGEFRNWLKEIQSLILSGKRNNALLATRKIKEFLKFLKDWADLSDVTANIKYKIKEISLKHVPVISELLEASGLDKIRVKDPILAGIPKYVSFVSAWYQ